MTASSAHKFDVRIFLAAVLSGVSLQVLVLPTEAQAQVGVACDTEGHCAPPTSGPGSSSGSIKGVVDQRFNQIITNRVLGTVLLGVNEQINCSDCVSGFGSAGSFSVGVHGRKEITSNLSILGGIAYTQYGESGYKVTDAPIAAFALRYDFTDWGSSRPFFDVGAILTPFEKVSYSRNYGIVPTPGFGGATQTVATQGSTNASDYGVYARAGWITRLSPRDEVAGSVEVWQLWQTVNGYNEPGGSFDSSNPFSANVAGGTDRTNLVKLGAQWTHLFGDSIETNINGGFVQSFGNHSGLVATVSNLGGTGLEGVVASSIGNQYWFEYGGRVSYRIAKGWAADLFLDGTAGPQPVGNTIHGGIGIRASY
jgi:hypothetical protein